MDEENDLTEQPAEHPEAESAESRRQFINKLVAAAGTFAVAEMLAGADAFAATKKSTLGGAATGAALTEKQAGAQALKIEGLTAQKQAGSQFLKIDALKIDAHKIDRVGAQSIGTIKQGVSSTRDVGPAGTTRAAGVGFVVSLQGRQLGEALVKAGVIPADSNLDNAKLTIEFSA